MDKKPIQGWTLLRYLPNKTIFATDVWECDFNKCNFINCVFKNYILEIATSKNRKGVW